MWYHVGSKNEVKGRTGFAHLFEHVMFTGSGHVPYGLHDKLTEGVGGSNNGTTSNDRTTYYETVPSNYLESSFGSRPIGWGSCSIRSISNKLDAQRDIVKNERRQGVDNQPYGRAGEILAQATYPASHPYSWDVIGSMDDLSAATEEDVKNFFRLYYAPNNAFLAIVGDFDPVQAKAWVQKYFGDIPRGKPITRPTVAPVVARGGKAPCVRGSRPDATPLRPVADGRGTERRSFCARRPRRVLSGPRTARLTKALVYDKQSAGVGLGAARARTRTSATSWMTITPRPGTR